MSHLNLELISNLAASNSETATENIVLDVRKLGALYGWDTEQMMEVGNLICNHRKQAVEAALEVCLIAFKDVLK
jgi:hypothetical protein